MKISAKVLTRLVAYTVAGMSLVSLLLPQPSWAQMTEDGRVNPLQDFEPEQNRDPFSSAESGDSYGGILDLMHRAQMGNIRSMDEYSSEQNQSLDAAAAKFRSEQQRRIQNQQQQAIPGQQQVIPVNPDTP